MKNNLSHKKIKFVVLLLNFDLSATFLVLPGLGTRHGIGGGQVSRHLMFLI